MKFIILVFSFLLFSHATFSQTENGFMEVWKGFSDPEIFSSGFLHQFQALPLEGTIQVGPRAWSGDFWSSKKGSINIRWNSPRREGFDYKSPSKTEAAQMPMEELKQLSPTEKFDLLQGRYDYPLVKEVGGVASKLASDWAGICNGWSPASLFHNEPTPKTLPNPDGILVPFGSGDIKALLSYFYAYYVGTEVDQIGLRCFFGSWMGGARACNNDLNAGAFHIVMANKLGLLKEGFVMDVDRFAEVWNQPVVAYKSVILTDDLGPSSDAAETTVREVRIATEIFYIDESMPTWNMVHGTKDQIVSKKDLQYRVELNAEGKIVGGEWESRERPDFIWNKAPARTSDYRGLFTNLPVLLND